MRLRALFLRHAIVDDVLHFARLDDRSGRLRDVCLQNHAVHARICPGHGKAGQAAREERKAVFFCEVSDHRRQRLCRRPALCDIICVGRHDLTPVMLRYHIIRTVEPVGRDLFRAFRRERPQCLPPHGLPAQHVLDDIAHGVFFREALDRALDDTVDQRVRVGLAVLDPLIHGVRRDLRSHHPVHGLRNCVLRPRTGHAAEGSHEPRRDRHVDRAVQRRRARLIQKLPRRVHPLHHAPPDPGGKPRRVVRRAVDVRRHILVLIAARPLRQYAAQRFQIAQCLRRCCHRREKRSHDRRLLPDLSRRLIKLLRILIIVQHLLPFRKLLQLLVVIALLVQRRLRVVFCIRPHLVAVQLLPAVPPEQILVFLTQVPDCLLCPGQHALAVDLRLALLQRVDLVLQLRHALPIFRKPGPGEMRVRLFDLQRLDLLVQLLRRPPHAAHLIPLHGLRRFCTPVLRIHVLPHLLRGRRKPAGQQCALSLQRQRPKLQPLQRQRPKLQPLRRLHAAQIILVRPVLRLHRGRPSVFLL